MATINHTPDPASTHERPTIRRFILVLLLAMALVILLASCTASRKVAESSWISSYKVTQVEKTDRGYEVYVLMGREPHMTIMPSLPDSVKPGAMLSFYRFIRVRK